MEACGGAGVGVTFTGRKNIAGMVGDTYTSICTCFGLMIKSELRG